jgi:DNA-binding response OmpR family regulator
MHILNKLHTEINMQSEIRINPKATILIVEDDTPTAMMMVHVLSRAGCEVQVASTGKKGLGLAKENRFDLIALDIDLPDISGWQVCHELKQRHFSRLTPIVFVSGRPTEENQKYGFEIGAVDFIAKPFGVEFAPRLLAHIGREREISH